MTQESALRRNRQSQLKKAFLDVTDDVRRQRPPEDEKVQAAMRDLIHIAGSAIALNEELLDERRMGAAPAGEASGRPIR